jgi:hypothetical protein
MSKTPSAIYRQDILRWGVIHLATPEHEALLCGQQVHDLSMDDLEAYAEVIFGGSLRHLAPAEYRPALSRVA